MNEYSKAINQYIEDNKDKLIATIQKAVQIKSVTGNEMEIQEYMKNIYSNIGLDIHDVKPDYTQLSSHPSFVDSGIPFENRKNVVGIYHGLNGGKSLTLHGHVDVVSPEPAGKWNKDPWGGIVEGNKLYGRGSADMKSGLIANWFALKAIIDLKITLLGEVQLHSVIEEEAGGGGGALACLENGYVTDGYITSEPHFLNVTVSHAGIMYFRVTVYGKSAHAGLAHEGVNAIGKMYKIYNALEELDVKRSKEVYFDLYAKGSGQSVHLNLGTFKAGDWVSNVPGKAELEGRIGFIPGETRKEIKELIKNTVQKATQNDDWFKGNPPRIEWFGWSTEAWNQDPSHPFVSSFIDTASSVLQRDTEIVGRASGNDARFTQYYNKPGIAFGPKGYHLHGPDEYVDIDSVIDVTKVFANYIVEWCGTSNRR